MRDRGILDLLPAGEMRPPTSTAPTAEALDLSDWPRSEFWQPRWVLGRDVRQMIAQLDPQREDAEITHLSLEVLLPAIVTHLGYAAAGARLVAVPRVADRVLRGGSGDQVLRPRLRDADTLTFFGELIRRGHRSAAGIEACGRIQRIHRSVKGILNEDQIYTLCTLVFLGERFAASMGRPIYTELEDLARFNFWCGVARAMGLRDLPETRHELLGWMSDYEHRHFAPEPECRQAADAHIRGVEGWFPGPLRPLARSFVVATMEDHVRECLGYQPVAPVALAVMRAGWRSLVATTPLRPMRLDSSWVKSFSRVGPNPDLERIGYGTYGDAGQESTHV
jgi:ER-bound oxygenase mpaB/B'/Rubber oxygenase, catalytic domain